MLELKSNGLTLYEISTTDKLMRSCAENEHPIRQDRGDSEMEFDKLTSLLELPETLTQHLETSVETYLFNNPGIKKYADLRYYIEGSVDYNLQPCVINDSDRDSNTVSYSNYSNELFNKLPLTAPEYHMRKLDNNSKNKIVLF